MREVPAKVSNSPPDRSMIFILIYFEMLSPSAESQKMVSTAVKEHVLWQYISDAQRLSK